MFIDIPEVKTYNTYKPSILAIILTKNKISDVIKVVESLFNQVHSDGSFVNLNVCIGDTGSDFDNRLKWKKYWQTLPEDKQTRIAKFDGMKYHFASNTNFLVEHLICPEYTPEVLLMVNNDVEIVQNNVIDQMLSVYNLYNNIGTIGLQTLYTNGFVQHQGIQCIQAGKEQWGFSHVNINSYKYDYLPRITFGNSGCFFMVKTELFYKMGKFSTQTKSCMEDVLFSIDCLINGYLNITVNSAICYHDEGSTRKREKLYAEMLQYDVGYVNAYLKFRNADGKSRAEIIAPFIQIGDYIR